MKFVIFLLYLCTVAAEGVLQSLSMLVLHGKQSLAPVFSTKQVRSRLECITYCSANTACEAANVIRRDGTVTCQMLLDAVDTEDDLDGNSDADYLYRG